MKRLTPIERSAVGFALAFIVVGAYRIVHPTDMIMVHPGPDFTGIPQNQPLRVSKSGSRIYGGVAFVMGIGISWFAFCRGRSDDGPPPDEGDPMTPLPTGQSDSAGGGDDGCGRWASPTGRGGWAVGTKARRVCHRAPVVIHASRGRGAYHKVQASPLPSASRRCCRRGA